MSLVERRTGFIAHQEHSWWRAHKKAPHFWTAEVYLDLKALKFYIMQGRGRAREMRVFAIGINSLVSNWQVRVMKTYIVIIFHDMGISFSGVFCILLF